MTCGFTAGSCEASEAMQPGIRLCARIHSRDFCCCCLSSAMPLGTMSRQDLSAYPPSEKSSANRPSGPVSFRAQSPALCPGMLTSTALPSPKRSKDLPAGLSVPFQSNARSRVPSHHLFRNRIRVWKSRFPAPSSSALETRMCAASRTSRSPLAWSQSRCERRT